MPRKRRVDFPGATHHGVAQGNGRGAIVFDDVDRRVFVNRLTEVSREAGWNLHAWCLLTTHVHLLVHVPLGNLSAGMGRLLGWYAHRFNCRHGREGHLFASPFWSRLVDTPEYHVTACVYVALNPVGARLCRRPEDYPWWDVSDEAIGWIHNDAVRGRARFMAAIDECAAEIVANTTRLDWKRVAAEGGTSLASP
ncbi:MAG: transposase [Gaiella sp.]